MDKWIFDTKFTSGEATAKLTRNGKQNGDTDSYELMYEDTVSKAGKKHIGVVVHNKKPCFDMLRVIDAIGYYANASVTKRNWKRRYPAAGGNEGILISITVGNVDYVDMDSLIFMLKKGRQFHPVPVQRFTTMLGQLQIFSTIDNAAVSGTTPRREISFFTDLTDICGDLRFTQQYPVDAYRLDAYFEKAKIVVEFDEEQHKNNDEDAKRMRHIVQKVEPVFVVRVLQHDATYNHIKALGCVHEVVLTNTCPKVLPSYIQITHHVHNKK